METNNTTAATVFLMTSTGNLCADCPAGSPHMGWTGPLIKHVAATFAFITTFKGVRTIHVCTKCATNRGLLR